MNVVFALIPEKGHINPYIGPAQALAARGHVVTLAAPGDIAAQCAAASLDFVADLIPDSPGPRPTHGAGLVELIQDAPRLTVWIEQLLLSDIPPQVERLRRLLRRLRADVVVLDPLYYPAALAAHAEGLPWASVSNSLNPVLPSHLDSALLRTIGNLDARRAAIFASVGLTPAFRCADVLSPFLNVAFTTAALCGAVPDVELVGPSFPLAHRGDEVPLLPIPADAPVVYASFGSQIYHWPEIFHRIRAAVEPLDVHLILSVGELAGEFRSTARCHVYSYAPQRAILERARVFLTHGGANSFMESIAAAVPMLLSPMCNDQFHQAYFLEQRQIGIAADLRAMSTSEIAGAVECLLADGPMRRRMEALSASYQTNGAVRTAELVEGLRR